MKSKGWAPLKTCRLMKSEGWAPLWVDADSKKYQIQMVQMTKNLAHSFCYILYQPKGVPIPRDNYSRTGGTIFFEARIHRKKMIYHTYLSNQKLMQVLLDNSAQSFLKLDSHQLNLFYFLGFESAKPNVFSGKTTLNAASKCNSRSSVWPTLSLATYKLRWTTI